MKTPDDRTPKSDANVRHLEAICGMGHCPDYDAGFEIDAEASRAEHEGAKATSGDFQPVKP